MSTPTIPPPVVPVNYGPPQYPPPAPPNFQPKHIMPFWSRVILAIIAGLALLVIGVVVSHSSSHSSSSSSAGGSSSSIPAGAPDGNPPSAETIVNSSGNYSFGGTDLMPNGPQTTLDQTVTSGYMANDGNGNYLFVMVDEAASSGTLESAVASAASDAGATEQVDPPAGGYDVITVTGNDGEITAFADNLTSSGI